MSVPRLPVSIASPLVKPTGVVHTIGIPSTPDIRRQYDVHIEPYKAEEMRIQQGSQVEDWGVKYLQAKGVHDKTRGEQAAVFILDTAGSFTHPDLAANSLEKYAKNFSNAPTLEDKHGHGTHCAGLAAALDNNIGVLGMAPGAKLVPIKVLNDGGSGSWEGIASAIRYVADLEDFGHKKIISMSLGGSGGNPVLQSAISYALSKGVFIVVAAGNSGYRGDDTVLFPGAYPGVLTIASIGPKATPSSFSSGGPSVDLTAPGEKNLSTHKGDKYVRMSGTSMATPHVAGAIALVLSHHPEITNQAELMEFLMKGASDLFDPSFDPRTGMGAPIMTNYIK